jgi:DNA-binding beta-propeller fold protein YncE
MTGQAATPDLPAGPAAVVGADPELGTTPGPATPPDRRRRRLVVLLLLIAAVIALLLFGAWYLLFRKPISELPLPGITVAPVPHYEYSIYDVVAPTGVAVTPDGSRIYATQTEGEPAVIAFGPSGNVIASLAPPSVPGGEFVPVYVAVDPTNGDLYVSDRPNATIHVFSAAGTYLRTFDPGPELAAWAPLGLTFDATGNLFVTNVGGPFMAVHQFGPDGRLVRTFGRDGDFEFPNGVAVDSKGNVYVTDSNNGRLVVFDANGAQLGMVRRGVSTGDLGLPRGAAIDDEDRIYVADIAQQGVQSYQGLKPGERAPTFIGTFGEEGTADGAFRLPNAVAVDGRSRVYVADWRNDRIQVWTY